MDGANPADEFIEVIAREVTADPGNLALREDFVTLLLGQDPGRAATELDGSWPVAWADRHTSIAAGATSAIVFFTKHPPQCATTGRILS